MSKHTPGPWTVMDDSWVSDDLMTLVSSEDFGVAMVYSGKRREGYVGSRQGHANALLIAAAPDLLEALKQIHDRALHSAACGDAKCGCHAALRAVKAAIAKAEGR